VDRPDPPASGGGQGPQRIAVGRALAVIVVAVVIGVLIVHSWGSPGSVSVPPSALGTTTTTTAPRTTLPTTTTTTTPHGNVKVLVANGSTTNGVATGYTTALQRAGWNMLVPTNAKPPPKATSNVYYAANKQAEADTVASALGLPLSTVLPISPATPVDNVSGADVVVVIGSDLAAKSPPSTVPASTTTAPRTTTTH